jgi:APA family basic amino acid/polyamine antiporter
MGELAAWLTSWILILEFSGGPMTVAAGWSGYIVEIFRQGGIHIPEYLTTVPSHGGLVNLPAILISLFVTFLLVRGTQTGALVNNILVVVKLGAIFLFLMVAAPHFKLSNWENFTPFGMSGVFKASALMILAYTGFDSVATAVEECKNPKRDVVIGLIGSLLLSTVLYMAVSGMLTGIVPFTELNNAKPLAHALTINGSHIGSALVAVGGVAGMTTVILVQIYAQSRVLYVMARDGLLPKAFCKLHPKYHTPYISTFIVGITVALVSGFVPISILGNLASMATLAVFIIASFAVLVLRKKFPDIERPFKCPAVYAIATVATVCCAYLFIQLIPVVGKHFLLWVAIGLAVYLLYSYKRSNLNGAA